MKNALIATALTIAAITVTPTAQAEETATPEKIQSEITAKLQSELTKNINFSMKSSNAKLFQLVMVKTEKAIDLKLAKIENAPIFKPAKVAPIILASN